jgi:transcriptional regulator with XRE-family HTH domain
MPRLGKNVTMPANITGVRIREVRQKLRYDQLYLVVVLKEKHNVELSQSNISEIETGIRGVKDFELNAIADVLNVSPEWLLRGGEVE